MAKLDRARVQCHHAVQLNTHVARAYVPAREDDSHTSLHWSPRASALEGEAFTADGRRMQVAVRLADLTLLLFVDGSANAFALDGRTFGEAVDWLGQFGLDAAAIGKPLHFTLDTAIERFELLPECAHLANTYAQAAAILEDLRVARNGQPVRCWPHHFDIATLFGATGAGMSPGDGSYPDPYCYVNTWPYPPSEKLPALNSEGHWHTEGWTGAVLPYERFTSADAIRGFIDDAIGALARIA